MSKKRIIVSVIISLVLSIIISSMATDIIMTNISTINGSFLELDFYLIIITFIILETTIARYEVTCAGLESKKKTKKRKNKTLTRVLFFY